MVHGGRLPSVRAKAQERIDNAADRIVEVLIDIVEDSEYEAKDRINAAKELLGRTLEVRQPTSEVKHSGEVVPSTVYAEIVRDAKAKIAASAKTRSKVFGLPSGEMADDDPVDAEVVDDEE